MTLHPALSTLRLARLRLAPLLLVGGALAPATASQAPLAIPIAHRAEAPVAQPAKGSLLAAVPGDAYVLVHCRDFAAVRARAERNDWYRLLGLAEGESLLTELAHEFRNQTHSEMDSVLSIAQALEGEVVFFDTGTVAGFVTEPPASSAELVGSMRAWLPQGDAAARRTFELAGGTVELVAWPDEPQEPHETGEPGTAGGWSGRTGHFAALVVHPRLLAIYSGDDAEAVTAALTEGVTRLAADRAGAWDAVPNVVSSYLASGGGEGGGIELFVDFSPLVGDAEAALKRAADGVLPDPTSLLGLDGGTWMHARADVFPGTRVECSARLRLPPETLASQLADTFGPLPHTLPADLPKGVWGLYALNWDLELFYRRARAAYEEADRADGLQMVDAALGAAQGMAGVDPFADVLGQLAGDFALYYVDPADGEQHAGEMELRSLGFLAGLIDGAAFQMAFEKLIDVGGLESVLEREEIAGVDAYTYGAGDPGDHEPTDEADADDGLDGGVAFLPSAFTVAPSRRVLERALRALTRVEDASLDGSRMQGAFDENAGACFFSCLELTPLRFFLLPELAGDVRLSPLDDGHPARDPFDSQLVSTARRTPDGFEFRIHTR